jgi:hypothetical protein
MSRLADELWLQTSSPLVTPHHTTSHAQCHLSIHASHSLHLLAALRCQCRTVPQHAPPTVADDSHHRRITLRTAQSIRPQAEDMSAWEFLSWGELMSDPSRSRVPVLAGYVPRIAPLWSLPFGSHWLQCSFGHALWTFTPGPPLIAAEPLWPAHCMAH